MGIIKKLFRLKPKRNARLEELLIKRPFVLNIETTNICNARCCFCAYTKSKRPKTEMSLELYRKVVRDYSEMGGGPICFTPIIGDFFLDSFFMERIKIAREYPNIGMLSLTTNGIALDRIEDLSFFLKNTDFLQVSIGGISRESYKKMYGVDRYERVKANILKFAKSKNEIKPDYPFRVIFRVADISEVRESADLAEYERLGIQISIDNVYGNWAGLVEAGDLPPGTVFKKNPSIREKVNPCFIFYLGLCVTSSGLASICGCMNSEASELIIGDLNKESLKKIWQNQLYKDIKSSFGTENMPEVCKQCTQYLDGVEFSLRPEVINFAEGHYPFGY